jgi:hypothetical protein
MPWLIVLRMRGCFNRCGPGEGGRLLCDWPPGSLCLTESVRESLRSEGPRLHWRIVVNFWRRHLHESKICQPTQLSRVIQVRRFLRYSSPFAKHDSRFRAAVALCWLMIVVTFPYIRMMRSGSVGQFWRVHLSRSHPRFGGHLHPQRPPLHPAPAPPLRTGRHGPRQPGLHHHP